MLPFPGICMTDETEGASAKLRHLRPNPRPRTQFRPYPPPSQRAHPSPSRSPYLYRSHFPPAAHQARARRRIDVEEQGKEVGVA
jgi:hypothetical protein